MQAEFPIQRKKALLSDDDADLLQLLRDFLEGQEFAIQTCQNPSGVFETIEQYGPDLIILDYLLDGINGGEICHQIKTSSRGKEIPVILFSAYPRVLLSLGTYGCDQFIPKPFDLGFLLESIKRLLKNNLLLLDPVLMKKNYRSGHILFK